MASQWITLAKIGGLAGEEALKRFNRWVAAREPHAKDSDVFVWPDDICEEADKFVQDLAEQAPKPPVLFYCKYIDLWSMGDIFKNIAEVELQEVSTNRHELYCFDLVNSTMLLDNANKTLRRRLHFQEYRWYALFFREAIKAWKSEDASGALIVIREPIGGLVEDHEIVRSLTALPDWLNV